jgi:DNA modification methylase
VSFFRKSQIPLHLLEFFGPAEIGLEPTPAEFVAEMVVVFRSIWRVLRNDGTCWLNLGDSYNAAGRVGHGTRVGFKQGTNRASATGSDHTRASSAALKAKDLLGIPWRVAFALQDDGWYLRRDIIWHKETCMPESVEDRCTTSHEYLFHLTKSESYFYDWFAIAEPINSGPSDQKKMAESLDRIGGKHKTNDSKHDRASLHTNMGRKRSVGGGSIRNKRSVWTINPQPFKDSHFATMPPLLAETCILAGTSEVGCCPHCGAPWECVVEKGEPDASWRKASGADSGGGYSGQSTKGHTAAGVQDASAVKARILEGMRERFIAAWQMTCDCPLSKAVPCVVLDPFSGAGTTSLVADRLGRDAVNIELNPEYVAMQRTRIEGDAGLFAQVAAE